MTVRSALPSDTVAKGDVDCELDDCDDEPSLSGITVECKGSMRDMEGPECA